MYGVIVQLRSEAKRENAARTMLREVVIPTAKQLPGFASGTWLQALEGNRGIAVMLFESEEAACGAAERIRTRGPLAGDRVVVDSVGAYEVLARA